MAARVAQPHLDDRAGLGLSLEIQDNAAVVDEANAFDHRQLNLVPAPRFPLLLHGGPHAVIPTGQLDLAAIHTQARALLLAHLDAALCPRVLVRDCLVGEPAALPTQFDLAWPVDEAQLVQRANLETGGRGPILVAGGEEHQRPGLLLPLDVHARLFHPLNAFE